MTVNGFGEEWSAYDQSTADHAELERIFDEYFERFPWQELPPQAVGFDLGCGSGRWAKFVANRVGHLHCVDASPAALEVAQRNLAQNSNCEFHCASVDQMPILDGTMDFGFWEYSITYPIPLLASARAWLNSNPERRFWSTSITHSTTNPGGFAPCGGLAISHAK